MFYICESHLSQRATHTTLLSSLSFRVRTISLFQDRSADLAVGKEIRVSPYRLAAHLATAFATFSLLVHTGFQVGGAGL